MPRPIPRPACILPALLILAACSGAKDNAAGDDAAVRIAIPSDSPALEQPPGQPGNAAWSRGSGDEALFGAPGATPLLRVACVEEPGRPARLRFTRWTRAPEGAKALFALEGNRHVARVALDVVKPGDPGEWRGDYDPALETALALKGTLEIKATLPGGGTLAMAASPITGEVLDACRAKLPASARLSPSAPPPEAAGNEAPEG